MGVQVGAGFVSCMVSSLFKSKKGRQTSRNRMLTKQAELFAKELGALKGSVMKVGQLLSVVGIYFGLPPEAMDCLCNLQESTIPLEWDAIFTVLKRELTIRKLQGLEIDHSPLASASIGQAHRARELKTGAQLCIKVQYPGVSESIKSDLESIRRLIIVTKILPDGFDLNMMIDEVARMLWREVDYKTEFNSIISYKSKLKKDERYIIPSLYPRYSSSRVLTMSYEKGVALLSPQVVKLDLARRNALGIAMIDLFLNELFAWNLMQTDPHFGNYKVRIDSQGENDKLVLLDFGATLSFSGRFRNNYMKLVRGAFHGDISELIEAIDGLEFMPDSTPISVKENFAELCLLVMEPFGRNINSTNSHLFTEDKKYSFGESDLPSRLVTEMTRKSATKSFRLPPREIIFLHRKLAGLFVILAQLDVRINPTPLFEPWCAV
jgi:predicted unusual protein kinase regulating ubiquinone biosynthesis (AarF/ABC1/UbiB family)